MKENGAFPSGFYKETDGIFRLQIPFDGLYTSVFLIETEAGAFLLDCGTTKEDVEELLLPALEELGYDATALAGVVLSHRHDDHAGGLPYLLAHAKELAVITDERALAQGVVTYALAGHTEDSLGVLDTRSGTLITGDGLQFDGVNQYPRSTPFLDAYLATLDKIARDGRVENMLYSHAYDPERKDAARGRDAVLRALTLCRELVK